MQELFGVDLFGEPIRQAGLGPLAERFIMPPFSVLSARDGAWQERKAAWLSLGIKSELGRVSPSHGDAQARQAAWKRTEPGGGGGPNSAWIRKQIPAPGGNSLPACDYSRRQRAEANGEAGTSVFDPVLCELAYSWWCPPAGVVLDPFAGGSVRGIVAACMRLRYYGIELRGEQVAANEEQAKSIITAEKLPGIQRPVWICGDSLERLPEAPEADFIFTCPPYGDLERYSDDPRDLSTQEFHTFIANYNRIIMRAVARLKQNRFACIVVGDYRDRRTGHYRNFVGKTIEAFEMQGCMLYNEAVLVTAVGSLPVRVSAQFHGSRKLGKTHQNMLVFIKGDPRQFVQDSGQQSDRREGVDDEPFCV